MQPGRPLVLAGDHLVVLNERAELTVLAATAAGYAPVARYEVADPATWAHPVMTARGVVMKDATTLALLGFGPTAEGSTESDQKSR